MSTLTRRTPSWWLMHGLIGCIWMTLTSFNSLRYYVKESSVMSSRNVRPRRDKECSHRGSQWLLLLYEQQGRWMAGLHAVSTAILANYDYSPCLISPYRAGDFPAWAEAHAVKAPMGHPQHWLAQVGLEVVQCQTYWPLSRTFMELPLCPEAPSKSISGTWVSGSRCKECIQQVVCWSALHESISVHQNFAWNWCGMPLWWGSTLKTSLQSKNSWMPRMSMPADGRPRKALTAKKNFFRMFGTRMLKWLTSLLFPNRLIPALRMSHRLTYCTCRFFVVLGCFCACWFFCVWFCVLHVQQASFDHSRGCIQMTDNA